MRSTKTLTQISLHPPYETVRLVRSVFPETMQCIANILIFAALVASSSSQPQANARKVTKREAPSSYYPPSSFYKPYSSFKPSPFYGSPSSKPIYNPSRRFRHSYDLQVPSKLSYGPPKPEYGAPKPMYGPPNYRPSKPVYGPPNYIPSKPIYGPPNYTPSKPIYKPPSYTPSKPTYGPPSYQPDESYGPPSTIYGVDPGYGAPSKAKQYPFDTLQNFEVSSSYEIPQNLNNYPLTEDASSPSYNTVGALDSYGSLAEDYKPVLPDRTFRQDSYQNNNFDFGTDNYDGVALETRPVPATKHQKF